MTPFEDLDVDVERDAPVKSPADVILEQDVDGNSYLHLVLPADRINFLNGMDSTFFN